MALGDEFRAFRSTHRISQRELGEALGISRDYVGQIERGVHEPADRVARKFRRMADEPAAATEANDDPVEGSQAPPPPPFDQPPLGEEPPPLIFGADEKGRTAVLPALGPYDTLQQAMYQALVGKDVAYKDATGKRLSTHTPGLADVLPPADGAVIRQSAAQLSVAYVDWAKTSPRMHRLLNFLFVGPPSRQAIQLTGVVVYSILMNHGVVPNPADFARSLLGPAPVARNGTDPHAYDPAEAPGPPYPPPV